MCGIAGILVTPQHSRRPGAARAMVDEELANSVANLRRQGPDDVGLVTLGTRGGGAIGLGHTRLAILDTPAAGHQPMTDPQTCNWSTFNTPKPLLVNSLKGLLPLEIVYRRKQGFTLPFALWMRGAMRAFCEARLDADRIGGRGILRPAQVQRLWRNFLEERPDVTWARLWVLVVLEERLERNGIRHES